MGTQKQGSEPACRGRDALAKRQAHEEGMGHRGGALCSGKKEERVSRPEGWRDRRCSVWLAVDLVCVYVVVSMGGVQ